MPVVVVGAGSPLGGALVSALRAQEVEVRATVGRREELPPAGLGVPTAVSDLADGRTAGAVLEGAHTVVLLDTSLPWEWLLDAAEGTGVRRIVLVQDATRPAPEAPGYEVVTVHGDLGNPRPGLLAEILAADRRA
jgi:uncharacterized protein YbjT (DUF2867 family)